MSKTISLFFVAVVLGLAWAMRGHFGHEWGASWAGAMGALAVILVSGRKDWVRRAPVLTALGAIGWAVGGMMSYGIVIGYCRSESFLNSLYGYAMLAVIGALYGFIGGGLFGLGLETGNENKPKWPNLIVQMFAGGFLVWGLIIYQMEWLMTPPRSELWAGCLGAAIALGWYMYRNNYKRALRVALYAALGAGFGFSFGNFLQLLGSVTEIQFNWWNVMEFTLGFFGGLGMVYAVLTREWTEPVKPSKSGNWIAIVFVFLFIPLTNYFNGFSADRFIKLAGDLNIADTEHFASLQMMFGGIVVVIFAFIAIMVWKRCTASEAGSGRYCLPVLLLITTVHYMLFSYIRLGTFYRSFTLGRSESSYIFILILLFAAWYFGLRKTMDFPGRNTPDETSGQKIMIIAGLLVAILAIATISVNIHSGLHGAHDRFGL